MRTTSEPYLIDRRHFEPAYLRLYESGELNRRVERALEKLTDCRLCPRDCGVNRLENKNLLSRAAAGYDVPHDLNRLFHRALSVIQVNSPMAG